LISEGFFPELSPGSTVEFNKGIVFTALEGNYLAVEPESASWTILDESSFTFLKALQTVRPYGELGNAVIPVQPEKVGRFLSDLFRLNFISIDGSCFYDTEKLWHRSSGYPHFFSLHITNRCNFSCRYCYNDSLPARSDMPLETVKFIIKKLLLEIPLPGITVEFHGGEPLLLFDEIIVPAVHFGESLSSALGKKMRFLMQTNGSLISRRAADFIAEHDMGVGISCDGGESIHNRNRVFADGRGTYEKAMKGLETLLSRRGRAGTLATIERPEEYCSVIRHAAAHNIRDLSIRPVYPMGRAAAGAGINNENSPSFAEGFMEAVDLISEINSECMAQSRGKKAAAGKMMFRNLCSYLEMLISKERADMCYRSPCGAGNSISGFDTDGDIYPCEEMTGIESLRMGNIYDSKNLASLIIDSSPYRMLDARRVEKLRGCGRCEWRRVCGGGCISKIVMTGGDFESGDYYCGFHKAVLSRLALAISARPSLIQRLLSERYLRNNHIDSSLWSLSILQ